MLPAPKFIIYGLFNPRDGQLRYVGKTSRLLRRYANRLLAGRQNKNTYKAHWINALLRSGMKPEIDVLEHTLKRRGIHVRSCEEASQLRSKEAKTNV